MIKPKYIQYFMNVTNNNKTNNQKQPQQQHKQKQEQQPQQVAKRSGVDTSDFRGRSGDGAICGCLGSSFGCSGYNTEIDTKRMHMQTARMSPPPQAHCRSKARWVPRDASRVLRTSGGAPGTERSSDIIGSHADDDDGNDDDGDTVDDNGHAYIRR